MPLCLLAQCSALKPIGDQHPLKAWKLSSTLLYVLAPLFLSTTLRPFLKCIDNHFKSSWIFWMKWLAIILLSSSAPKFIHGLVDLFVLVLMSALRWDKVYSVGVISKWQLEVNLVLLFKHLSPSTVLLCAYSKRSIYFFFFFFF